VKLGKVDTKPMKFSTVQLKKKLTATLEYLSGLLNIKWAEFLLHLLLIDENNTFIFPLFICLSSS
jgi:hypothetical protein